MSKLKQFGLSVFEYLLHDSTWKGIVSVLTAFGVSLSPEQSNAIIAAGLSIVGAIQVFWTDADKDKLKDKK